MGLILKILIGLFVLGLAITIFEKVTGINITGDAENEEENEEEKVYSPLEIELKKIEPGAYGRAEEIAKYVIPLYKKPRAELGTFMSSTSIETIVSKYIDNQLFFSEKYEDHVIALTGKVETIGKDNNENVYISIGDGHYYYRSGTSGESVKQLIECYINNSDMEDDNFKDLVLNMRPGVEVTLVGVLSKERYGGGFNLYGTTLIEVGGIVPDRIMNIAVNSIYEKYKAES